jgi:hypothetical protein
VAIEFIISGLSPVIPGYPQADAFPDLITGRKIHVKKLTRPQIIFIRTKLSIGGMKVIRKPQTQFPFGGKKKG